MNIFELSLFKAYIYYPNTNTHLISINLKIFIVAFYIALLPAISIYLSIISSMLSLFIAFQYNKIACINSTLSTRLHYLFNIFLIILLFHHKNITYFIIFIPYQLKTVVFSIMGSIFKTKTSIIYLQIDQAIMRIYIILLHYFTLQKLILSTTKTEDLLNMSIRIISTFIKHTTLLSEIRFSLLLSYKFAYFLEDEIKNLVISFYLMHYDQAKGKTLVSTLKIVSKLIYLGIKQGMKKVCFRTQVLYIREIEVRRSQYWLI